MKTLEDVKNELAHLKQLPARPRLERLMREGKGLVEMLEVLLDRIPAELGEAFWNGPVPLPHRTADEHGVRRVFCAVGQPMSDPIEEVRPATVESFVTGPAEEPVVEEPKRKRGRPAGRRRVTVETGGAV